MRTPWYREGLCFECHQCGNCCTGDPGYVWVTRAEWNELARHLGLEGHAFARKYLRRVQRRLALIEKANGDCVFYDRGCTVYPARPLQCRTFPFWPENLRSRGAWEETAAECPGVGNGPLYSLAEIRAIRKGEREASGGGGARTPCGDE